MSDYVCSFINITRYLVRMQNVWSGGVYNSNASYIDIYIEYLEGIGNSVCHNDGAVTH